MAHIYWPNTARVIKVHMTHFVLASLASDQETVANFLRQEFTNECPQTIIRNMGIRCLKFLGSNCAGGSQIAICQQQMTVCYQVANQASNLSVGSAFNIIIALTYI